MKHSTYPLLFLGLRARHWLAQRAYQSALFQWFVRCRRWKTVRVIESSGLFDREYYISRYPDVAEAGIEPLIHFLLHGAAEGRAPSADFDTSYYLAQNPDVAASGMNPLSHYILYGGYEHRAPKPPQLQRSGSFEDFDPSRETVLVVSHDATRTGAPIIALNIIEELKRKYNVVALLLGHGTLEDSFVRASDVVLGPVASRYDERAVSRLIDRLLAICRIKYAIVNSIESRSVLEPLAASFVPSLALIHEFCSYTRPRNALRDAVLWATETVFPAEIVRDNAINECAELGARPQVVIPPGRCKPPTVSAAPELAVNEQERIGRAFRPENWPRDTMVIIGVGTVILRKGVDLFLSCASQFLKQGRGKACRFVWIGSGYDPDHDAAYSVYLEDQIHRAGLGHHVAWIDETEQMDFVYRHADVLLLTSRLDPMPNVAIEAMSYGLPVLCFEGTTGIADVLKGNGLADECVVPYLDVDAMSKRLDELIASPQERAEISTREKACTHRLFDLQTYVQRLDDLALECVERMRREEDDCRQLAKAGSLRLDFTCLPNAAPADPVRTYVRSWRSGVSRRKPVPGFHPGIYEERRGGAPRAGDPFLDYHRAGMPEGPWRSEVIAPLPARKHKPHGFGRLALHIHAHYPELLPEIFARLSANRTRPELFISATSEKALAAAETLTRSYDGPVADLCITPNRGRDLGPLLTLFGRRLIEDYDFIGHIHTKQSADLQDPPFAKSWRFFLLENLIGGRHGMIDCILARMAEDPTIGLVFPDDPYVVGWESNWAEAGRLGARLGLSSLERRHFNFPVGSMFWARSPAIRCIVELDLQWEDYPAEPLDRDGTTLHCMERMFPFVAEQAGFRCVLTNVPNVTR